MTLPEIRDNYKIKYLRECRKRKLEPVELPEGVIALDLSETQQDIQRRHSVLQGYTTITLQASKNTYNLPSNFGKVKAVMIGGLRLTEKSFNEIIESPDTTEMTPNRFCIYTSGNTTQIIFHNMPDTAYTAYVYYYLDLGYYSPSGNAVQNWGEFDNNYFYGTPVLPEKYSRAIVYGMLANEFPDYEQKYENELRSLRESRISSLPKRPYSMGGYKTKGTEMTVIVESTTVSTGSTGTSNDNPSKIVLIEYAYATNTITIGTPIGYTGTITGSWNGTSVVISSDTPEFSINNLFVIPNNFDCVFTNTSSAVTITPPSNTNFTAIIKQYE